MDRIEKVILRNLVYNEEYLRKVLPFIEPDYFNDRNERVVFEHITKYAAEYNSLITKEVLQIEIEDSRDISQDEVKNIYGTINELEDIECDFEWLSDTTLYNKKESRIQFDLEYFNKITKGGLPNKTLNIALAGTGVGKSLFMCHHASSVLLEGKNVLYITLEMAEEKIAERIDANLLNVNIQEIVDLPKPIFESKVSNLAKKTQGSLIIKEYPTASAHSGHFKALLNELALKKSFKPDIIFIDYLNICASSRYRAGSNVNSYSYIKAIAEELRGLAVEANVPIVSATQTTRSGFASSDVDLTDTSESFGLPATADLMFALISTEELEGLGQIMVKQLKNRYNDPTYNRRFVIGVDRTKMRLYDCEQQAQDDLLDSGQEVEYNDEDNKVTKKFAEFKF